MLPERAGWLAAITKEFTMLDAAAALDAANPRAAQMGVPINALLLDDSKFDRRRIRRLSREMGVPIQIDEVATLSALQEVLDADSYDVVLLDYRLTEGDGLQALDLVRAHPRNAKCPAIMVAGGDDPTVAVRALHSGFADYLSKAKLTAESLRDSVLTAIEKADLAASAEQQTTDMAAALSDTILAQFRRSLQPELAGVVRNLRAARAALSEGDAAVRLDLEAIEARCVALWALLSDLGETPKLQ
jgi:PleD family two-component response regulator